jgi:CDP-diacylglycerol--serine O-phosphatidyltransferase
MGAFLFIVLAAVFDFLDGYAARMLNIHSPIGAELDSLADVVSFGVAPGFVVFSFFSTVFPNLGVAYLSFLIPVFSALRLAKFNIDTRQTSSFLGLPVPANGLFWAALIPSLSFTESNKIFYSILIAGLLIAFCLLMVSELPMFSLKFKHYKWKGNQLPYTLVITAIVFVALFQLFGVCLTILLYILLSFAVYLLKNKNEQKK